MAKIAYKQFRLSKSSKEVIDQANTIIADYQAQGYKLTLRQLYYQFVSRDLVKNNLQSYKRIGSIVNDARLAGLIDWDAIEDRTRELSQLATWSSPSSIIYSCAQQFRTDYWATQPHYIEVWVEKEALAGVVEGICEKYRVPFLSCRGYTSQSEMWKAGQRFVKQERNHSTVTLLHLGDHDPSGIDMSRDIQDRLQMFAPKIDIEFERLALNMQQINQYNPPPNFAKQTDSRFQDYDEKYGSDSWELDALEPKVITTLIEDAVLARIDQAEWQAAVEQEAEYQKTLFKLAKKTE